MNPLKATSPNVNRVLKANSLAPNNCRAGLRARPSGDDSIEVSYSRPVGAAHASSDQIDDMFTRATIVLAARGLALTRSTRLAAVTATVTAQSEF